MAQALLLLAGALAAASSGGPPDSAALLRTGDLVFQESHSSQANAIALATHGRYTHVGVVLIDGGRIRVLEAGGTVAMTPYAAWVDRGQRHHVVVRRLKDADTLVDHAAIDKMRAYAREVVGKRYDFQFGWSDDTLYCSELAYKLYERATGVTLGKLQKLREFDLDHPLVQKKLRERYGDNIPLDEPAVSPQSIFDDARLVTVFDSE